MSAKVFGLGIGKTGTMSLHRAFRHLGLKSLHYPRMPEIFSGQFGWMKKYDAISDTPIVPFYPQLDAAYPGSKFILTVRKTEDWLKSLEKWWSQEKNLDEYGIRVRILAFGVHTFHPDRLKYAYEKHIADVQNYFKNRPRDLLTMNICEGDGWEKLCPFLNKPVLDIPFPFIIPKLAPTKPKKRRLLDLFRSPR